MIQGKHGGGRWKQQKIGDAPRKGVHVGDRVRALALSDEPVPAFELDFENVVKPSRLVLVSLDSLARTRPRGEVRHLS
jgi:hypothetical protein